VNAARCRRLIPAALLAAILAASCCPLVRTVSISGQKSGGRGKATLILPRTAVRAGFVISYTHSVNKGRVHDFYSCRGNSIVLDRTVFASYGAGIPEAAESPGASFSKTDSGYEIAGIGRQLDGLLLAVGLAARHSIALRNSGGGMDGELFLEDHFERQTPVHIRVRRVPLLYCLLRGM
jgi:hypothetical protein